MRASPDSFEEKDKMIHYKGIILGFSQISIELSNQLSKLDFDNRIINISDYKSCSFIDEYHIKVNDKNNDEVLEAEFFFILSDEYLPDESRQKSLDELKQRPQAVHIKFRELKDLERAYLLASSGKESYLELLDIYQLDELDEFFIDKVFSSLKRTGVKLCEDKSSSEEIVQDFKLEHKYSKYTQLKLDLSVLNLRYTQSGMLKVNELFQTSAPNIFAFGKSIHLYQDLTQIQDELRIVLEQMRGKQEINVSEQALKPYELKLDQSYVQLGLSEALLEALGVVYQDIIYRDEKMSLKLLIDISQRNILGAVIISDGARDLVSLLQIAMKAKLPVEALRDLNFSYESNAQVLKAVLRDNL